MSENFKRYVRQEQTKQFWNFFQQLPIKLANLNYKIASNPNLGWEYFKDMTMSGIWFFISFNPDITLDLIKENPDKPWNYFSVCYNENIMQELIKDGDINFNIDIPLNWDALSINSKITWDIICKYPDGCWIWKNISRNPNITWEIIKNNPDKPWKWDCVSQNPNITPEIIKNNPDETWNINSFVDNDNLNIDFVKDNFNKISRYLFSIISRHPNITWNDIIDNIDFPWDWNTVSLNPNVTWDIILNNPNFPWEWDSISSNPNITCEIINNNPDRPWNWDYLSNNINLTYDFVLNNKDKPWNWEQLCENTFPYQNELIKQECMRREKAIKIIKRNYLKAFWAPDTYLGRKRLKRSYDDDEYEVWSHKK